MIKESMMTDLLGFDVFFISYDERNADKNWQILFDRYPQAQRVQGVKGIYQAHTECAKRSRAPYFFVVDGDNEILDDFEFQLPFEKMDDGAVYVWRCSNPINDLVYGYGAVKLFSKASFSSDLKYGVDMTTSVARGYVVIHELASITRFNTSEYETWKSAFRECVKLSSKVIKGQRDQETEKRLDIWCHLGENRPFGLWCLRGAREGREFGLKHAKEESQLSLINDFSWLRQRFSEQYSDELKE